MEKIPQLENCCMCLSLREGTKVYGIIHLALGILASLSIFFYPIVHSGQSASSGGFFTNLLACLLLIVPPILLLLGALRENPLLLLPWLIITPVVSILSFLYSILTFSIVGFINAVIYFAFNVYGVLVVLSYYRTLTSTTTTNVV